MEPRQRLYPSNGQKPDEVMLEGMKVLFDDKVGLYPVTLVAKPAHSGGSVERRERRERGRTHRDV